MNIGFTIGKFAPFHNGHKFLISKAMSEMDEFYIVVYDTPQFGIDIKTKIDWLQSEFPNAKILQAYNSPKQYGLDTESVDIQMKYLSKIINGIPVTHFYSSEEYGKYVAKYLKIKNVIVDKERKVYNICATRIRNNVEKEKEYISKNVYDYMKSLVINI